ncbi:sigma-70 family RNA polymerase sigma factor [Bacteroides sp.]|uniref:sigma-70 family RNA polymerase sigma factor n=1 Tax=Bacteroides sp. TaxID=29523 RepID=UPI0025C1CF33|nr:sigma-70 family RNA polymerase sigma factor [Bacteroides sp.]
MESMTTLNFELIEYSYKEYRKPLYIYLCKALGDDEEARDMVQDVFLKLIDYRGMLRQDTVKSFIFTIARNLILDYHRRYSVIKEFNSYNSYIYEECSVEDTSTQTVVNEILCIERNIVSNLPLQRRKVYELVRYEEKYVAEISLEMNLSVKTVENHLLLGRRYVRECLSKCI